MINKNTNHYYKGRNKIPFHHSFLRAVEPSWPEDPSRKQKVGVLVLLGELKFS